MFQSTLPTRGSDPFASLYTYSNSVSIHAPHEGERQSSFTASSNDIKVSIHAPHEGERHAHCHHHYKILEFQSTLPTRGSDSIVVIPSARRIVSIHAPHEGERLSLIQSQYVCHSCFNPRSPRGGATFQSMRALQL